MHVLFCTDGSRAARDAVRFGGAIARACDASATLLGVVEHPSDRAAIEEAVDESRRVLESLAVPAETVVRDGRPVDVIPEEAKRLSPLDLVVIGAKVRSPGSGLPISPLASRVVRSVRPPVLVVPADPGGLRRMLVCTSGTDAFVEALALPARIATRTGAEPTLLHVLPEPPGMYDHLTRSERGRKWILAEDSRLTDTLRRQLERLEAEVGATGVSIRHGLVTEEILEELEQGDYDLVVTGSVPGDTSWPTYVMGNVTRELLDRADHPVLVLRTPGIPADFGAIVRRVVKQIFSDHL